MIPCFQEWGMPYCFSSRTLTKAECNYSRLRKMPLGLVFGVNKFHKYIYGCRFTLVTCHKPVVPFLGPTAEILPIAAA